MKSIIHRAEPGDAREVAVLRGEFLNELMVGAQKTNFHFNLSETEAVLKEFLERSEYVVLIARSVRNHPLGYINIFEMRQQYVRGPFGIIDQLYIRPQYRREGIGHHLMEQARTESRGLGWRHLELTIPAYFSLPDVKLFLQHERFVGVGERKQKLIL